MSDFEFNNNNKNNFKLPNNLKQVGNIDLRAKVYLEDYVNIFLREYCLESINNNFGDRLAFLIGSNFLNQEENIILISGAIEVKYTQVIDGVINFTQESWNYAYGQIEKYFNGLEIIGLMQSQPGYNLYLNDKYINLFRSNFNKLNNIFLVMDPREKSSGFYVFDELRENLLALSGYFIYYAKNESMCNYMADLKNKNIELDLNNNLDLKNIDKDEPPEILIRKRQLARVQKNNSDQKKVVNLLASLCAVLFLICFIMGTGLVQNEDRISKLEKQLASINFDDKNKELVLYLKDKDKNNILEEQEQKAEPVFFSQVSPRVIK
jgi:hypothetical protein